MKKHPTLLFLSIITCIATATAQTSTDSLASACYARGVAKMDVKDSTAFDDFAKAIAVKPDYVKAYISRGSLYFRKENYSSALRDYDKAVELKPDFVQAWYLKALAEFSKKDYKAAIVTFTKIIGFTDQKYTLGCYYFRGLSEAYSFQKEAACRDFDKALEGGYKDAADAKATYCQ